MHKVCRPGLAAASSVIVALSLVTVPPGATSGARFDGPVVRTTAITLTALDMPAVQPRARNAALRTSVASDRAKTTADFLSNLNGIAFIAAVFLFVFAGVGICLVACIPAYVISRVTIGLKSAFPASSSARTPSSGAAQPKKVNASTSTGRSNRAPRISSAQPASATAGHRRINKPGPAAATTAKAAPTPKRAGSLGRSGRQ